PSEAAATDSLDGTAAASPGNPRPAIPGFDGWQLIHPEAVDIGATEGGFAMTLTKRALWFESSQGVLFWTTVDGNFRASATVSTSKTSDSGEDPGGGGITQLAGLMARAPATATENYVLVDVGVDTDGPSVETKSTTDGHSAFEGPAWPSADAELQLCRIGTTFTLWKREIGSDLDFTLAATFRRPDLKGPIQVGANIYSDGPPDITAQFNDLAIEPLDPGEPC
ncbi:MAG TPA: hypothetical protein VFW86_00245, partial [Candidatus Limnocylindrales bacterium]|nr:hypothetical protein [Candidatus Limnocylindrales bacterium]